MRFSAILSGIAPALQISRSGYQPLKEGGRTGPSGALQRVRSVLVTLETAIALVLLIGAGLLIKSFQQLQDVNPGFEPAQVLSLHLSLPESAYPEPAQVDSFFRRALDEIRTRPGVQAAGAVSVLPMNGITSSSGSFSIEGREVPAGEQSPHGARWSVTPGYFETMQIPLLRGRVFSDRDSAEAPGVALIDEAMARKYWPDNDPIGKRITFEGGRENPRWREIVGVVGHVKHEGLETDSRVQYYIPHSQRSSSQMFVVVRAAVDPTGMSGLVRAAIQKLDPSLPVYRVMTMDDLIADSMAAATRGCRKSPAASFLGCKGPEGRLKIAQRFIAGFTGSGPRQVPEGRPKVHYFNQFGRPCRDLDIQPSCYPSDKSLGYFQPALRALGRESKAQGLLRHPRRERSWISLALSPSAGAGWMAHRISGRDGLGSPQSL